MKKGGGPAFPYWFEKGNTLYEGMTLRDYFAAHAPDSVMEHFYNPNNLGDHINWRYRYADAMLRAREQK